MDHDTLSPPAFHRIRDTGARRSRPGSPTETGRDIDTSSEEFSISQGFCRVAERLWCERPISGPTRGSGRFPSRPRGDSARDCHPSEVETKLKDQHGIAVAVEAIAKANGLCVSVSDQLFTRQRGDQDEQAASGQVEIRDQRVEAPENVTGADE